MRVYVPCVSLRRLAQGCSHPREGMIYVDYISRRCITGREKESHKRDDDSYWSCAMWRSPETELGLDKISEPI